MGVGASMTALDICRTPLTFMEDYAARNQIELKTVQADILEFDTTETFDAILTHAFMGNFDDARRQRLVGKWQALLSERGKVVTIQRVRPPDSPSIIRFSEQQSADFVAAAISAAERNGIHPGRTLTAVKDAATRFAESFSTHAIRSKPSLERLFLDAGMVFDCLEYQHSDTKENLSGPSVPSGGEYAHIVAGNQ